MSHAATEPLAPPVERAEAPPTASVVTRMSFAVTPEQAWDALLFYEQVEERPPLHLRLLLPVPTGTRGRKSRVGDEALCFYEGGHLVKRITEVDPGRRLCFDVVEQELAIGGGMRLSGGGHALRELPGGGTEVALLTRYVSPRRPRWLWGPVEAAVCHLFHRHILRTMRRAAEAGRARDEALESSAGRPEAVAGSTSGAR